MNNSTDIKILIVSHNVISDTSNMGKSMMSYFSWCDREQLRQVFFHNEIPMTDMCDSYYRFTDMDALKSIFNKKNKGTIFEKFIKNNEIENKNKPLREKKIINKLYALGRKRTPMVYLLRNTIWRLSSWNNDKLYDWISAFNPDVIYFASGDYVFAYKIVDELSKQFNIPIVVNIFDDFYFQGYSGKSIIRRYNLKQYKNCVNNLLKKAKNVLYISPNMKRYYDNEFEINGEVLYRYAEEYDDVPIEDHKDSIRMSYIGGLGLKRWESLLDVSDVLLKSEYKDTIFIDVYSQEKDLSIINQLKKRDNIIFHGEIDYNKTKEIIKNSDILLVVESLDRTLENRLKMSLSTKVSEYLLSDNCILAYGPESSGTISYIADNMFGEVANNKEMLMKAINSIIGSENRRAELKSRAKIVAKKNHTKEHNYRVIKSSLYEQEG